MFHYSDTCITHLKFVFTSIISKKLPYGLGALLCSDMMSKTKKGQDIRLSICSYVARLIVAPLVAICISAID